jgi:hypothetical protein
MEIKTSKSYQKEVLEKYRRHKGGEMSNYLANPTRKNIRAACLWLLDRRKEREDQHILNRFFQFREGEDKAKHIQGLKSEKADKFIPVINFLRGKTNDTSDENIELISWLIDFKPRPCQEYLKSKSATVFKDELIESTKTTTINETEIQGVVSSEDLNEPVVEVLGKNWIKITLMVSFGVVLMIFGIQKWGSNHQKSNLKGVECMTWADTLYVMASCDEGPFSKYGTQIEPIKRTEFKNMRKVEVNAAYKFFSENGNTLIWYYKKNSKEIEYFTAPGLHPINGETLKKITPYIIQRYVPLHMTSKESFLE